MVQNTDANIVRRKKLLSNACLASEKAKEWEVQASKTSAVD
jgi:hypothetical protein